MVVLSTSMSCSPGKAFILCLGVEPTSPDTSAPQVPTARVPVPLLVRISVVTALAPTLWLVLGESIPVLGDRAPVVLGDRAPVVLGDRAPVLSMLRSAMRLLPFGVKIPLGVCATYASISTFMNRLNLGEEPPLGDSRLAAGKELPGNASTPPLCCILSSERGVSAGRGLKIGRRVALEEDAN